MKYPLLLTSLLFLSLLAAAQTQKDTVAAKIKDTPASKISLSKLPKSNIKLYYRAPADSPFYQFSHFEVIDERPDTALYPAECSMYRFGDPAQPVAVRRHLYLPG
jgi:hypothetical protein